MPITRTDQQKKVEVQLRVLDDSVEQKLDTTRHQLSLNSDAIAPCKEMFGRLFSMSPS